MDEKGSGMLINDKETDNKEKSQLHNKLNRTFARRIGKRLSDYNKTLLENLLPTHQYSKDSLPDRLNRKSFLEIGFGMGEHLSKQAMENPENLYIGVEAYLNGVANLLKLINNKTNNHWEVEFSKKSSGQPSKQPNLLIWPNDLDMILNEMPEQCLDGIYILFPDPWHKRRYLKKRLVNTERLKILKSKLKFGGFIMFASDIEDYFEDVKKLFTNDQDLVIHNNEFLIPHEGYCITKYHHKALKENRIPRFIQAFLAR